MYILASRKIRRKLETRVSLLLFICLAVPAVSQDNDLEPTSESAVDSSSTIRHCGRVLVSRLSVSNKTRYDVIGNDALVRTHIIFITHVG